MIILMSIIKAINDVIITRNDIISTLITISVTSFRNNQEMAANDHLPIQISVHYCHY